jgi:glycosyltransferase involved in cell wall biosynthesis
LPNTLAGVPAGAQIFVLDADSSDATVEIALAAGARVEVRRWYGFVDARRYALAQVRTPWTLMLDADEELDPTLAAAIVAAPGDVDAYRMRRVTALCGVPIRSAGWSNEKLIRLFRTDRAGVSAHSVGGGADLHERWTVHGPVRDLPGAIWHDSYPTLASYWEKFDRYTSIEANAIGGSPLRLALAALVGSARFVWSLVRYGGWRDGRLGFFVAFASNWYPVVVQWKALQARR